MLEKQLVLLCASRLHPGSPFVVSLASNDSEPGRSPRRRIRRRRVHGPAGRSTLGGRSPGRSRRRPACRISFSTSKRRFSRRSSASSRFSSLLSRVGAGRSSASAWAIQFRRHDSEIDSRFAIAGDGFLAQTSKRDGTTPELRRVGCRHEQHPPWWTRSTSGGVSGVRGQAHTSSASSSTTVSAGCRRIVCRGAAAITAGPAADLIREVDASARAAAVPAAHAAYANVSERLGGR